MRIMTKVLVLAAAASVLGCSEVRIYLQDSPVKITELHFDPSEEQGDLEFIEITNMSSEAVDLSGWYVTGAGRVALPAGTRLDAGQSLVLVQDLEAFKAVFGDSVVPVAILDGKLSNEGEAVRVETPDEKVADEVVYDPDSEEVAAAEGTGKSIHRTDFTGMGEAVGWKAGDPSPGSAAPRGS